MPEYVYKAVTKSGKIVTNKVEDGSKQVLIKRLKSNGLTPISITQRSYGNAKKAKKNVARSSELLKGAESTNLFNNSARKKKKSFIESMNLALAASQKVTPRDLVVFTQNFYLLKKANFNNVHALETLISSTENPTLRGVLEDILAGVEGRRLHVRYYGILFRNIPIYLYKYD